MKGDLMVLYQEKLDRERFCGAVFELLYGDHAAHKRLDQFSAYCESNNLPNNWIFPTFFLFMCHPETEIFVKPVTTKAFLDLINAGGLLTPTPNGDAYKEIREIAALREEARKPAEKFVDETAVYPEIAHILCSCFGSVFLLQLPTIHGAKGVFLREFFAQHIQ